MNEQQKNLLQSVRVNPPARLLRKPRPAKAPPPAPRASWHTASMAQTAPECVHRGGSVSTGKCMMCNEKDRDVAVLSCTLKGLCTNEPNALVKNVKPCQRCNELEMPPTPGAPSRVALFNEFNLAPGAHGKRFNCSLLDDPRTPGGFLLAYRDGWSGSEIHLCRLDDTLRPAGGPWRLNLHHPIWACYGREDPRLFLHAGRVHVAYIGVQGREKITHTNMMYARLSEDCSRAEEVFYVHYRYRNSWEKNWQFFSHGGQLHAVYCFAPHRILKIDGDVATFAYESDTHVAWRPNTEIRGGASPVLVGDEFWSFFHSRYNNGSGVGTPKRQYTMGLYAFRAVPPFDVLRVTPEPVLTADPRTNRGRDANYADVVFPCGAVRRGGDWLVSMGLHDRYGEIHRFDHADLEALLKPCRPPAWWSYPPEADETSMLTDAGQRFSRRKIADDIHLSVSIQNEYGLPDGMGGWSVLDVGAHVGSFAHAAHTRGAGLIHCYEPAPEHFQALARNAPRMRAVAFNAPVGCGERAVTLDEAILRLAAVSPSGRVELLKIDCEGCEWPALCGATRLDLVDRVVGEYHLCVPGAGRIADLHVWLAWGGLTEFSADAPRPPAEWALFLATRPARMP